jgi:hypothetical protein
MRVPPPQAPRPTRGVVRGRAAQGGSTAIARQLWLSGLEALLLSHAVRRLYDLEARRWMPSVFSPATARVRVHLPLRRKPMREKQIHARVHAGLQKCTRVAKRIRASTTNARRAAQDPRSRRRPRGRRRRPPHRGRRSISPGRDPGDARLPRGSGIPLDPTVLS